MKVSLVVASGAHEGRVIPLTGTQFLIGRDAQCHLRPASQAISKLHCGVLVRDGTVFVKDFGSTNGTLVNDAVVQNAEVVIADGASVRVGPLDFKVKIESRAAAGDATPLPSASLPAAKPAPKAASLTPNPARPITKATPPKPAGAPTPKPATKSSQSVSEDDHDRIAAMLLGMDDEGNGSVPDGSTVMDIPNPLTTAAEGKPDDKQKDKDEKKPAQTREEMSSTANDLLRKYMRRPK